MAADAGQYIVEAFRQQALMDEKAENKRMREEALRYQRQQQESANKRAAALQGLQYAQDLQKQGYAVDPYSAGQMSQYSQLGDYGALAGEMFKERDLRQDAPLRMKQEQMEFDRAAKEADLYLRQQSLQAKKEKKKKSPEELTTALRKEISTLGASKDLAAGMVAAEKIQQGLKLNSPAGDIALIMGYNKALDPRSTVREGEFAQAANAGSLDTKVMNAYRQVMNGTRLSKKQREDFANAANALIKAQVGVWRRTTRPHRTAAKAQGLPYNQIFPSIPEYKFQARSGLSDSERRQRLIELRARKRRSRIQQLRSRKR